MKKLALNVDSLTVQTFDPGACEGGPANALLGTRMTRCGSECGNCTYTNCHPEQRTEIDCIC